MVTNLASVIECGSDKKNNEEYPSDVNYYKFAESFTFFRRDALFLLLVTEIRCMENKIIVKVDFQTRLKLVLNESEMLNKEKW